MPIWSAWPRSDLRGARRGRPDPQVRPRHAGAAARPRPVRAQRPEDGRPRAGRRQEAPPPRQDPQVSGDRAPPGGGRGGRGLGGEGERSRGHGGGGDPQPPDHHRGRGAGEDRAPVAGARAAAGDHGRRGQRGQRPRPWPRGGARGAGRQRAGGCRGRGAAHRGGAGRTGRRAGPGGARPARHEPPRAAGLRRPLRPRGGLGQAAPRVAPVDGPAHEDPGCCSRSADSRWRS